eukprot:m.239957 g.239957  ORF g.239957 m.239957 type:complete len:202 (+) comp14334_c0_seq1:114-719(+)
MFLMFRKATKYRSADNAITVFRNTLRFYPRDKHRTKLPALETLATLTFFRASLSTMSQTTKVSKSDVEWKQQLSKEEYQVLRKKGTERPGTGEYDKFYPKEGYFACRGCGNPLYSAESKFKSGCGWPAFDKCYKGSISTNVDSTFGMRRVEIVCSACDGHLGHVFEGERFTDTNERHCVNSVSVRFIKSSPPGDLEEAKVV